MTQQRMTFEQIMQACQAIGDVSLRMRKPGDWYVNHVGVSIKNDSVLEGRYGNGLAPVEAIHDHWRSLTDLKPHEYLVCEPLGSKRRAVKWNGFMWADVQEEES